MTKQVQFSDEAYARLAASKEPGESFSDVVLRLLPRRSLAGLAELAVSDEEAAAHRRLLRENDALDRPRGRRTR